MHDASLPFSWDMCGRAGGKAKDYGIYRDVGTIKFIGSYIFRTMGFPEIWECWDLWILWGFMEIFLGSYRDSCGFMGVYEYLW